MTAIEIAQNEIDLLTMHVEGFQGGNVERIEIVARQPPQVSVWGDGGRKMGTMWGLLAQKAIKAEEEKGAEGR